MIQLSIHGPSGSKPTTVTLGAGESIVVGRRPDTRAATRRMSLEGTVLREHVIDAPSVSSEHVLVQHDTDGTRVTDLDSLNGTRLELPRSIAVHVTRTDALTIHLASASGELARDLPIPEPAWKSRDEYGGALARTIRAWALTQGLALDVTVETRAGLRSDRFGRLALPNEDELVIAMDRTLDVGTLAAVSRIHAYVARQNALFDTMDEMAAQGLVVVSVAMREAVAAVLDAASSDVSSLLLTGPSGAGKEGLARAFHARSRRAGPFVARNCGLLSRELARSELFGAERGAFTGSVARIGGAVESANAGTLFLDEVGELPKDIQPMLLRFLDSGEYERVGSYGRPSHADVRVVAATNADLRAAALRDVFRLDLWFRLAQRVVRVPPLSERFEDVEAYLRQRPAYGGRSAFDALDEPSIALLRRHTWDGNFRELASFAGRIGRDAKPASIDVTTCAKLLSEGSLRPVEIETPAASVPMEGFDAATRRAVAAYEEDHDAEGPASWDDVKRFVESYLKPVLFASLAGVTDAMRTADVDARAAAQRVAADRGTAGKQLGRFFERFATSEVIARRE